MSASGYLGLILSQTTGGIIKATRPQQDQGHLQLKFPYNVLESSRKFKIGIRI